MNERVDELLAGADRWRAEMETLRRIALDCGLTEAFKWRSPCYTWQGGNVAIIQSFKERCALMFFKGALLRDPDGLLRKPGESSRIARRLEFTAVDEIAEMEGALRSLIAEAIEIEKDGRKVEIEASPEPPPAELEEMFAEVAGLRAAFEALTPGRRRGYILHFSGAKKSATRRSRIEKNVASILAGKGLND